MGSTKVGGAQLLRPRVLLTHLPPSVRALVARAFSIFASFVLTLAVARTLPVAATGSFFVVYTLGAVAASFGRFGVDNLAIKLLGSPGSHRAELRHSWQVVAVASVLGGAAFGLALTVMRVQGLGPGGVAWAALTVPPQALAVVAGAILRGRGRLVWGILAELGSIPAFASVAILGAGVVSRPSLDGTVGLFAIATFLTAAWAVPMAVAATHARGRAAPDSTPAASSLREFLRRRGAALSSMMGASLLYYTVAWAPILTLTFVGREADVAWVTVATRLANFVTLVPAIQVSYLAPLFSQAYHTGRLADLNGIARQSSLRALAVVAVPAVVLAVGSPVALRVLYGAGFTGAAPLLSILVVGALVVVGIGQVNTLMLICDLERWALLLSLAVVVAWATVGIWLAKADGAWAVVIFSALGALVYSLAAAVLLARERGVHSYARTRGADLAGEGQIG